MMQPFLWTVQLQAFTHSTEAQSMILQCSLLHRDTKEGGGKGKPFPKDFSSAHSLKYRVETAAVERKRMSRQSFINFLRCKLISFWSLSKKNNFSFEFHSSSALLFKKVTLAPLSNKNNSRQSALRFQNHYISLGENRSLTEFPLHHASSSTSTRVLCNT